MSVATLGSGWSLKCRNKPVAACQGKQDMISLCGVTLINVCSIADQLDVANNSLQSGPKFMAAN
jgi:hypothetical protein